jgi:hypothetical protein
MRLVENSQIIFNSLRIQKSKTYSPRRHEAHEEKQIMLKVIG